MLAPTPTKAHLLQENEKRRKQQKELGASSCHFWPAQMCVPGREDPCAITSLWSGVVTDIGQESRSWIVRADLSCFPIGPQTDPPWMEALQLLPKDSCVTNTSAAMMLL